jgi:hypothetical protein
MSRYLIDRIEAAPNIELICRTEIVGLEGAPGVGLERVRWRDGDTGVESAAAIGHVFVFVGAEPATAWLTGCGVDLDRTGFVVTGAAPGHRPLESSVAGVRRRRRAGAIDQAHRSGDRRGRSGRRRVTRLSRAGARDVAGELREEARMRLSRACLTPCEWSAWRRFAKWLGVGP